MNLDIEAIVDLAAQLPTEKRAAFLERQCRDPKLRAEAAALLESACDAETYFEQAIQGVARSLRGREPRPGDAVGAWRIVSAIGGGGMGRVYLADRADGELEQRVAVKFLRVDGHRPDWGERFLRERQLQASLDHPSVARVIDAGHTVDGRPFLVMEHVEGAPIDQYAASISIPERLKLFLEVCEGVSHAHRRLIIHRDLKPSNILVDAAGHSKLLDFGIAKLLDETADVTQTADQLLTPNYASPEQMRGEALGVATDIYSLGAVLYKLLTGRAPRESAREAANGEPPPPSRAHPDVPEDIDFVIGKALRPEPELRYRSVDDFAADLRAVLELRPVAARGEDLWYRARKHLRRYWMPLTAALLVPASLIAGLLLVNRERAIAERRFADVRQLAGKLFDVDTQVAQLPGGSKTRQMIVDTALGYLRRLTADVRMEPSLALELGTAYMRVARVQGVNISPNLGQTQQADQTEQKAQALIDSVLESQPSNRIALLRAGQIAHDRMILAGDGHHDEQALQFAGAAVDRLTRYQQVATLDTSTDRNEAQQVIIAFTNVANRLMIADRFEEARRTANRGIEIARATNWPTQAGAALMIVALSYRAEGDLDSALRAVRESVRLLEPVNGEKSTGRLQSYGLALIREAQILGEDQAISLNRPAEAIGILERALEMGREFARRDPADFQSQNRMFTAETKLARIVRYAEPARALDLYDDALGRLSAMGANAATLRNEAATLAASTYPLVRLGRRAEARKRLDDALEKVARLGQYPADEVELGSAADDTLRALAEYEAAGGNSRRAAALYDDLLRLIFVAKPQPETSLEDAVELTVIYAGAAQQHRRAGEPDAASRIETGRIDLWRHWDARLPNNPFVRRQLDAARAR